MEIVVEGPETFANDSYSQLLERTLVDMGITSPAAFEGVGAEDLVGGGFTAEEAQAIIAQVPAGTEVAMVVKEEDCGIVVEPGGADQVVAAILRLKNDPACAARMGARGFAAYHAKYTLEKAVEAFRELWRAAAKPV